MPSWACLFGRITPVPIAVGNTEEQRLRLLHVGGRVRDAYLCTIEKIFQRYQIFAQGRLTHRIQDTPSTSSDRARS